LKSTHNHVAFDAEYWYVTC